MKKITITQRALIQRINRVLKKDLETLKSDRRGGYMHVDLNRNAIIEEDVDLMAKAKELSVLKAWEAFNG